MVGEALCKSALGIQNAALPGQYFSTAVPGLIPTGKPSTPDERTEFISSATRKFPAR